MNKKSTRVLLSILHICILGICALTIYSNRHSGITVAEISSDTRTAVPMNEPDTAADAESVTEPAPEPETMAEIETIAEIESEAEAELITEPQPESQAASSALYSFHFIGRWKNLNIRNAPSANAKIIGKIPVGGNGNVLELTNESWVLIEYNDIIGYCSRNWIELQKITE